MDKLPNVIYVRHGETVSNKYLHSGESSHHSRKSSGGDFVRNPAGSRFDPRGDLLDLADPKLTEVGKEQAEEVGNHFQNILPQTHYENLLLLVSPYQRTIDTSLPTYISLKRDYFIDYRILDELYEYTPPQKNIPSKFNFENDKDFSSFVNRVREFNIQLKDICETLSKNTLVIIFGHSLFFSVLLEIQSCQEEIVTIEKGSFHLPNCSLSVVVYDKSDSEGEWSILGVGSISHLSLEIRTGTHNLFI